MANKIKTTEIMRKKGKLYYLKGDPLEIWETDMNRSGRKPKNTLSNN